MSRSWVANCPNIDETSVGIFYATGLVGIAVFIHSTYIHQSKFPSIRICTDIAALTCAVSGVLAFFSVDQHSGNKNQVVIAVIRTAFVEGTLPAVVQVCDSYMFYSRLSAVQRIGPLQKAMIFTYIFVVLIFTWWPSYTIAPFFYDTNTPEYVKLSQILGMTYTVGCVAYNVYFTCNCVYILTQLSQAKSRRVQPFQSSSPGMQDNFGNEFGRGPLLRPLQQEGGGGRVGAPAIPAPGDVLGGNVSMLLHNEAASSSVDAKAFMAPMRGVMSTSIPAAAVLGDHQSIVDNANAISMLDAGCGTNEQQQQFNKGSPNALSRPPLSTSLLPSLPNLLPILLLGGRASSSLPPAGDSSGKIAEQGSSRGGLPGVLLGMLPLPVLVQRQAVSSQQSSSHGGGVGAGKCLPPRQNIAPLVKGGLSPGQNIAPLGIGGMGYTGELPKVNELAEIETAPTPLGDKDKDPLLSGDLQQQPILREPGAAATGAADDEEEAKRNSPKIIIMSNLRAMAAALIPMVSSSNSDEKRRSAEQGAAAARIMNKRQQNAAAAEKRAGQTSSQIREKTNDLALSLRVIQSIRVLTVKSIAHAVISSSAAIFFACGGNIGYKVWQLIVLLGMHFSFNMQLEKWSFCVSQKVRALSRSEREVEVMQRGRDDNFVELIEAARRRVAAERDLENDDQQQLQF